MTRTEAPPRRAVWRTRRFSVLVSPRLVAVTAVLLALLLVLGVFAMTVGSLDISMGDVLSALFGGEDGRNTHVVQNLRLPRVLTAIFAGAALGVSGAVFQSVSRNALGSPDIIGFTTGAATGAITQIVIFQGTPLEIALSAVAGGILTAAAVYLLSRKGGVTGGYRLVLVGIGVGAVLGALNGLMLVLGELDNAIAANLWLSGSLDARNWGHALPVMIGVVLIVPFIGALGRRASLMEMGDDLSQQLGVRVERTRLLLMLAAVVLAGLATGAAGPIAFIALAAPQLVIRLSRSRSMPVFSAGAMGAAMLLVADLIGQLLPVTATLPIGRITGIIGGFYLIWLLTRSKQV
ncbi:iron chelate uptake ABC transporter family permease subunit [Gulosibacter sp. 10]|uniref:FecCD family ABC transporter permease n=1 Tax=Gulosibacter sp. 10 TaxID=1255570 RepID=UPI00097E8508|nr:iron chelate uptake ABC transporter family permease subunit [Gulosibacter sp. 10]SJM65249.1 Ferric vibriobactin, enterobactin transport system, permease protein ViuG (TC 3.A.1.14.6) [Gulosibacter sp. 10]